MPNQPGIFSRLFSKSPAVAAGAPLPQNVPKNANTTALSTALRKYVNSLRKIRNQNPFGVSRNNLFNAAKANRNNVNRSLQNYVMNVNKAKYLNKAAQAVIASPAVPETQAAPVVAAAAQANIQAANAYNAMIAQNLAAQANLNLNARALGNLRTALNKRLGTLNASSPQYDMIKNALNKVNKKQAAAAIAAYKTMTANNLAKEANRGNALTPNARAALRNAINAKRRGLEAASPQYDTLSNALNRLNTSQTARQQGPGPAPPQPQPPTRAEGLFAAGQQAQAQRPSRPNLEKTIKAPNGRNIVVIRANNKARWNFKNNANKQKYNLRNRLANTPVAYEVNVNTGSLFNQGN